MMIYGFIFLLNKKEEEGILWQLSGETIKITHGGENECVGLAQSCLAHHYLG